MTVSNDELKNKVEEHSEQLRDHSERIYKAEVILEKLNKNQDEMKDSLENLKSGFDKLENTILSQNTIMLNSFNQLIVNKQNHENNKELVEINNDAEKKISIGNNITQILIKGLGLATTIIGSLYIGSKVIN